MLRGAPLLALALTLAVAGTARAESISYVEGGNVFLSEADGSRRVQLTTQGTADAPYTLAGTADDGRTVTSYGPTSGRFFYFFNPDGTPGSDGPNMVPMPSCGGLSSVGPIVPRLNPDGSLVTYTYFCNSTVTLTAVNPAVYTEGSNTPEIGTGYFQPSWFGNRLVVQSGNQILLQEDHPDSPYRLTFNTWIVPDPGEELHRAEVARPGGRVIVEFTKDGVRQVTIGTYTLPPPQDFTMACVLTANGNASEATFSPDGNRIAWVDSSGLNVGQVDLAQPGCLVPGSAKALSASGSQPRFSAFTLPAAPPAGGGGTTDPGTGTGGGTTTPPPGGGGATQAFLTAAAPARATLAQLVKGLIVRFEVKEAGTVDCALLNGRTKIGSGRKSMAAAGKGACKVKLTRKARRAARKLRRKRLTLKTTFKPKSGAAPVVRSKKIRIR